MAQGYMTMRRSDASPRCISGLYRLPTLLLVQPDLNKTTWRPLM